MLAPHVFGPVHIATKAPRGFIQQWDEGRFFQALTAKRPAAEPIARQVLDWAKTHAARISRGEGKKDGSFAPIYQPADRTHQLFAVWTNGNIQLYFFWYTYKPPFDTEEKRLELLRKLNAIEGIHIPEDRIAKAPSVKLADLAAPGRVDEFLRIYEWMIKEIAKSV